MKAIVKVSTARGVEMKDVPTPKIGDEDVLIKVKAVVICWSDVHIYQSLSSLMSMVNPPRILGHWACGEIVGLGKTVTRLKLGDLVAF